MREKRGDFSMDTQDLERCIDEDFGEWRFPAMCGGAGRLIKCRGDEPAFEEEIAMICKQRNIWFHADGACGAVGILLPEKRSQYKGLEMADSITLDPHKWLYIPYDCGCVLVRDAEKMRRALALASY